MADRPTEYPGQMPSSFDNAEVYNEKPMQKVMRKLREEPLVPLGIGLTVFAFVNAYRALRRGDSRQANRMFRARVAAQGFTVIAMVAGSMYYQKDREKTKELRKLQEEKDAEEKRQKWLLELEIRDQEEKALKARLQKRAAGHSEEADGTEPSVKEETQGTGGVLGQMGLWNQGQKAVAEQQEEPKDEQSDKKSRSPKSSLGAIGEAISKK
ncbi:Respiratory supercomplex factor 1 [Cladobotryum mycophilum]|uniref:Respiratory supercomplex factor 1 n=1 Tax=Cladobotryum mycophilum TaxID=491253 RepID=A0ABR0SK33_9HYPO